MNLILLDRAQCDNAGIVALDARQSSHLITVLGATIGTEVNVGLVDGPVGRARVTHCDRTTNTATLQLLDTSMSDSSPAKLPLRMIIALPRPKVARRLVQSCAELGVRELHFINSYRVEKSYWQSPLLEHDAIEQAMRLGLEQSRDSKRMTLALHQRFKPFIEDDFAALVGSDRCVLAHPKAVGQPGAAFDETDGGDALTVVVGPEGGFIDYEVQRLLDAGCAHWRLGPRIYRVETVVPLIVGRLGITRDG